MSSITISADPDKPGTALSEAQLDARLRLSRLINVVDDADRDLQALGKKSFFGATNEPVMAMFSKFARATLRVEYGTFNLTQKRELDWLFYERLPETVRALKTIKRNDYWVVAEPAIENLYTHLNALLEGQTLLNSGEHGTTAKQAQAKVTGTVDLLPGTRFPLYATGNEAVDAALHKLGTAWAVANAAELTVEDRYMINAIVDTYLPDMWARVQKLANRDAAVRAQADTMMLEQISLLQQQVDEIVDGSNRDALSAIKAYTLFLKAKVDQDNVP